MGGDDGFGSREGFELLSDETRLAILRTLADRLRERPEAPTLGFSALRRAVGVRDSGNFNYHLDRLEGRFVLETEGGYRLAPAGLEVVAALVAGTYGEGTRLGPAELEDECPACGDPLTATYENSLLRVACPAGHEFRNTLPPGAVDDRSLAEVVDLLTRKTKHHMELAASGVCPLCDGRLEWEIDPDHEHELPEFANQCDRCGARLEVPVVAGLLDHPAVVAFYHDHGVDVREAPLWAPAFYDPVSVDVADDPVRVEVTLTLDGDTLTVTLDGSLSVVDVRR